MIRMTENLIVNVIDVKKDFFMGFKYFIDDFWFAFSPFPFWGRGSGGIGSADHGPHPKSLPKKGGTTPPSLFGDGGQGG